MAECFSLRKQDVTAMATYKESVHSALMNFRNQPAASFAIDIQCRDVRCTR